MLPDNQFWPVKVLAVPLHMQHGWYLMLGYKPCCIHRQLPARLALLMTALANLPICRICCVVQAKGWAVACHAFQHALVLIGVHPCPPDQVSLQVLPSAVENLAIMCAGQNSSLGFSIKQGSFQCLQGPC